MPEAWPPSARHRSSFINDGPTAAADALAKGGGAWDRVWERFCEAPRLYRGVAIRLREIAPRGQGRIEFGDDPRLPAANAAAEAALLKELKSVGTLAHGDACRKVEGLEAEHSQRRAWVWAQLGESPLAVALAPLARLASLAQAPLGGASADAIAAAYAVDGWRCDKAAIDALAAARSPSDLVIVAGVVRALYGPWLDASARHFQSALSSIASPSTQPTPSLANDTCTLFVDGLRFDVAGLLQERLEARGAKVRVSHRLAPLPTVTSTAKPLAMPVPDLVQGPGVAEDFAPFMRGTDRPATAARLRDELAGRGVEVLSADDTSAPAEGRAGWTEVGRFDELGHKLGAELAGRIEVEVERVVDRVLSLLNGGWRRIRIVTDHGWLLLPGGLPKIEMPPSVIETKWARCDAVRGASTPAVPTWSWHWRPGCSIASPPGMGSFRADVEYAHGGVSPQECVVPELVVERLDEPVRTSIASVVWRGMRCRVVVTGGGADVRVDLRLKWNDATTSLVAEAKAVVDEVSLAVVDDTHEHQGAAVVLVDKAGNVVDRRATTVGEIS